MMIRHENYMEIFTTKSMHVAQKKKSVLSQPLLSINLLNLGKKKFRKKKRKKKKREIRGQALLSIAVYMPKSV